MNHVKDYDVVVTQDIGLTAALLGKKATVLHPRGFILDNNQIESALHMRYLSAKERRQGNYGKGPKAFTEEDKKRFKKKLNEILSKIKGNL